MWFGALFVLGVLIVGLCFELVVCFCCGLMLGFTWLVWFVCLLFSFAWFVVLGLLLVVIFVVFGYWLDDVLCGFETFGISLFVGVGSLLFGLFLLG